MPRIMNVVGLDRNYVRSVDQADTAWFDANLASDFLNTNPGGTWVHWLFRNGRWQCISAHASRL